MSNRSNVGQPLVQASLVGEAIDAGPVAVFVVDEEMRYVAVNGYACELLGYAREELLGLTMTDLAPKSDTAERFERLVADGVLRGRAAVRRKDGSDLELEYRAKTTAVAGMTLYVSVGWPVDDDATAAPEPRRRGARARG